MTSRAGAKSRPANSARPFGAAGLTLLELMLALSLVVVLTSIAVVSVARDQGRRSFQEGLDRLETLLRMTRAEAANSGRCFRIEMAMADEDQPQPPIRVLWEPQPLTEPGEYIEFTASAWSDYVSGDAIRVLSCALIGPGGYWPSGGWRGAKADDEAVQALMFYPDGASDSAVIELAPADEADELRGVIRLDGLNRTIRTLIVTAEELEENRQEIEQGLYDPDAE